jgi:hypothetical protein
MQRSWRSWRSDEGKTSLRHIGQVCASLYHPWEVGTCPISRADCSIVIEDLEKDVVGEGVYRRKWEVFGDYFVPQKKETSDVM